MASVRYEQIVSFLRAKAATAFGAS